MVLERTEQMAYGSFQNMMYAGATPKTPEVGMGATLVSWTDRYAYTVVAVETFKTGPKAGQVKAVVATEDKAKRVDANGMSECQSYEFETDPDATPEKFTLRKGGQFKGKRGVLYVGSRSQYHDFSF
jgi:hypothetical protein